MARLEELTRGASVKGIIPGALVTVIDARWIGSVAVELTYKDAGGQLGSELLYREREPTLEVVTQGRPWSFDGDAALFRLAAEAHRIRLAHLFDPLLAVHTSLIDPLPHQITAVYEEMLPRQPLRFLLADDPGAGKTIMAGLFMKELQARGDLRRCLIVCPGSLAEQWQDELSRRFGLPFDIVTRTSIEESRSGNPFLEKHLVIARLDHLSRNDDVQAKLIRDTRGEKEERTALRIRLPISQVASHHDRIGLPIPTESAIVRDPARAEHHQLIDQHARESDADVHQPAP